MAVDIDFSTLSMDDLLALAKRANEVKKDLLAADAERLSGLLTDFVTTVVGERSGETSEKSGWHGLKVYGLTHKVGETEYSVSVTITDVAQTEANKVALKAKGDTPTVEPEAEGEGDTPPETPAEPEAEVKAPAPAKRGK